MVRTTSPRSQGSGARRVATARGLRKSAITRHLVRRVLDALPARALPRVAWMVALVQLALSPRSRRRALEQVRLLVPEVRHPGARARLVLEGWAAGVTDALLAPWRAGRRALELAVRLEHLGLGRERRTVLLLGVGLTRTLAVALERLGQRRVDLTLSPRGPRHALWVVLRGVWGCVDGAALRRALRGPEGRVHVGLAWMERDGSLAVWLSPDLGQVRPGHVDPAAAVAQAAARLLGPLLAASPHLVHWQLSRLGWRPTRAARGHALSSRWAPWRAPSPRARRRVRPAR